MTKSLGSRRSLYARCFRLALAISIIGLARITFNMTMRPDREDRRRRPS